MTSVEGKIGKFVISESLTYLKTLPDKSFDLCITDPPYMNYSAHGRHPDPTKGYSRDTIEEYHSWKTPEEYWTAIKEIVIQLFRVCERLVMFPGYRAFRDFFSQFPDTFWYIFWVNQSKSGSSVPAKLSVVEPILTWNISLVGGKTAFERTVLFHNTSLKQIQKHSVLKHPCPKPIEIYQQILDQLKPKSIIDPFAGSGTIGELGERNLIPWLGIEMKSEYIPDMQYRIQWGKTPLKKYKEKKMIQKSLF